MAKLNIDVYVNDKGEVVLKNLGKSVQTLDTNLKSVTRTSNLLGTALKVAVGYLAISKITQATEAWAKLSGVQSIAEQQLKQAMISSGRYSDQFYQNSLKAAKGLQQLLGIGDEFIIQGQKMLISFARIPEELIPRVTKAMIDLSAFTGRTMEQSARVFGKASLGMTGELRRLAIPIDKTTFAMKGFEGVLEQVEHHVQGQVYAIREGYGAWKAYADQIKEVKERAGDFINAIFIQSGVLEEMITRLQKWNKELDAFKASGELDVWAVNVALGVTQGVRWMIQSLGNLVDFINTDVSEAFDTFEMKVKMVEDRLGITAVKKLDAWVTSMMEWIKVNVVEGLIIPNVRGAAEYDPHGFMGALSFDNVLGDEKENEKIANKHSAKLKEIEDDLTGLIERIKKKRDALSQGRELGVGYAGIESGKRPHIPSEQFVTLEEEVQKKIRKQVLTTAEFRIDELQRWYKQTVETYKHNEQDFAHLTRYKDMMMDKYMREYLIEQEKLAEETYKIWYGIADGITDTLSDAFADLLMGQEEAWKNLGKSISRIFANTAADIAKQKFIQPFVNNMMSGMFGVPMGNYYPSDFMGPLPPGAARSSAMMPYVGAGAMGYGVGGVGGSIGAMGGMWAGSSMIGGAMGGPIGMIAGGLLGGALGDLFGGSSEESRKYEQELLQQQMESMQAMEEMQRRQLEFIRELSTALTEAISRGFQDAMESNEYSAFIHTFESDLAGMLTSSFLEIMTTKALDPLMDIYEPLFQHLELLANPDIEWMQSRWPTGFVGGPMAPYTAPSGNVYTGREISSAMIAASLDDWGIENALPSEEERTEAYDKIKPVYENYTNTLQEVLNALGLNTDALGQNTSAILGPVESFLRELTVGQYAPAVSLEGIQAEYANLYEKAYFDPEAFSEFAGFAGDYLDFMKTYGDYGIAHEGVVSGTQAFPWYQEALEKQKEEQQSLSVNNEITLTSNITLNVDGRELGQVLAEQAYNSEDFHKAIGTIVDNHIAQG